jgi:AAA family ATP:ADP antiporter
VNTRNFSLLGFSYFVILFNYPFVRASSTTLFVEAFGAKASPQGWLAAVILLIAAVAISNRLQARLGFHKTFAIVSCASIFLFTVSYWAYQQGMSWGAFAAFAWKEVYIVLQVHLILAYANSWLKRQEFLKWVGPLGALGSLGGVAGGLATSWLARTEGTGATLMVGQIFIFLPALIALFLDKIEGTEATYVDDMSPLKSLSTPEIKRYVMYVAAIVALSQIVINIADFQFGILFEAAIEETNKRTAYLGEIYTATNALTFVLQIVILPLMLKRLKERTLHLLIPLSYLLCLAFGLNSGALMASAVFYTYLKASDYSFFSAGKELLYHPLTPVQKYGAKYFTDMLVYRASKAAMAGVLIYFQSEAMLIGVMIGALLIWLALVFLTFNQYRRIFHH